MVEYMERVGMPLDQNDVYPDEERKPRIGKGGRACGYSA